MWSGVWIPSVVLVHRPKYPSSSLVANSRPSVFRFLFFLPILYEVHLIVYQRPLSCGLPLNPG
jgi:hypothetical protein